MCILLLCTVIARVSFCSQIKFYFRIHVVLFCFCAYFCSPRQLPLIKNNSFIHSSPFLILHTQKTLYNDEMGKLKSKHERDFLEVRKEIVSKQHQIEEYDVQCRKLAKQIRQLNERQLDMYKENEFMKTRLKVLDATQTPGGHMQRSLSHRMLPPSSSMLSVANLKMEDEEGEVFNNTYLIDLKNGGPMMASGRTSPSRESICLSELQHRNSLVPRHLRSTYAVQYGDQGYREEDLQHVRNNDVVEK